MSAYLINTSTSLTKDFCGYGGRLAEMCEGNLTKIPPVSDDAKGMSYIGNAGRDNGSVVCCNSNNSNASARTENCNNNAGNGNDNYAGAFAVENENYYGKHSTACAASINTTEGSTATCALWQCDYDLPPFCEDWEFKDESESSEIAEKSDEDDGFKQLMKELKAANSKRKLKEERQTIKRFIILAIAVLKVTTKNSIQQRRRLVR